MFRLILRCRQLARERFSARRSDVLVKLELLDQKHVQDIVFQLHRFITALDKYHKDCNAIMEEADIFPIEVDLALSIFSKTANNDHGELDDDNDDEENDHVNNVNNQQQKTKDEDLLNIEE